MGVRVSSGSSEDVFSEDSDSNALSLVHDSDGDNPESSGESEPRNNNNMSRVGFTEAIRTKIEHVDSDATVSETQTGI